MIILGVAFIGEVIWLLVHGRQVYFAGSILFLFCAGDAVLLQLTALHAEKKLEWERQIQIGNE